MTNAQRQANVCKWAYDHIEKRDALIVDVETTGIDETAEIVQIVIVNAWGKVCFSSLVRPRNPIDEDGDAYRVHGISNKMVRHAPCIADLSLLLVNLLLVPDLNVIAYNAEFDQRMLTQSAGSVFSKPRWECAMKEFAEYVGEPGKYGQFRWHKLKSACAQMGLCLARDWHDAAADALATYDLMEALARRYAVLAVVCEEER